ncbi:ABC transporter ATP-binding protein [Chloroflexota bacterium]
MMAAIAQKAMCNLRRDFFAHMQTLSLSYFDRKPAGDLMSRLTNDKDAISDLLSQNITQFISGLATLISVLVMMLILNVWLTLATLLTLPVMLMLVGVIGVRSRYAFRKLQGNLGTLNGLMEETLSGQRVVIAYGQQEKAVSDFSAANELTRDAGVRAQTLTGFIRPLMIVLMNLSMVVVAGMGGYMAIAGIAGVTVGLIAAFISYSRHFTRPINQMSHLYFTIVAALAGAERIFEIIDEVPVIEDIPDADRLSDADGHVKFEHVDFCYTPGVPVLKDTSFEAQPGQRIAFVGPTGAGKTTLVNVLSRFYEIESGSICIDGYEIREVQQDSLRRQLGIVLQEMFLFADTVMENIRYGRLDASDEEVKAAAKLANAEQFILRLPQCYQTELAERGANLSQGQRQLLTIARAVLADPRILILDEATSSVDTRTEAEIQEALLRLMKGRTSFVIAHRLSTIREADELLIIDKGRILERGDHEELLALKGFYHNLYMSQYRGQMVANFES